MLKIGQAAREAGLTPKTIRYYEQLGLLPEAPRTEAGYRLYDRTSLDRLRFISRARRLGLSLGEARRVLDMISRRNARAGT